MVRQLCANRCLASIIAVSYTHLDVYKRQKHWAVRLNIKNVFDRLYYDSIYDNGGFTVPGTRRAAILTGELKF